MLSNNILNISNTHKVCIDKQEPIIISQPHGVTLDWININFLPAPTGAEKWQVGEECSTSLKRSRVSLWLVANCWSVSGWC